MYKDYKKCLKQKETIAKKLLKDCEQKDMTTSEIAEVLKIAQEMLYELYNL